MKCQGSNLKITNIIFTYCFFLEEDYYTPDEQENATEENTLAMEQFFDAKQSPKVKKYFTFFPILSS